MMSLAAFDFDGTITQKDSFIEFIKYAKGYYGFVFGFIFFSPFLILYKLGIYPNWKVKQKIFSFYFKGISLDTFNNTCVGFCKDVLPKTLRFRVLETITNYTSNEIEIIIISASIENWIKPWAETLGINLLICTKIEIDSYGFLTGKFLSNNCYGKEKVTRFKKEFPNQNICEFYSDSLSDTPIANIADKPYLIKGNKYIPWNEYNRTGIYKIKQLFATKDFILFIFCGGIGTLSNFIFSLIISSWLDSTISYVIGYILSLYVTYYLNSSLIFKRRQMVNTFIRFVISYMPNFFILSSFVAVFLNYFYWNKIVVYALAGLFGIPITYIFVKLFAFKSKATK